MEIMKAETRDQILNHRTEIIKPENRDHETIRLKIMKQENKDHETREWRS